MTRRISRRGLDCHLDIFSGFWMMLLKDLAKLVPKTHLMSEAEWRNLGVQQGLGWVHYMLHEPEPHILLFRRQLIKNKLQRAVATMGDNFFLFYMTP